MGPGSGNKAQLAVLGSKHTLPASGRTDRDGSAALRGRGGAVELGEQKNEKSKVILARVREGEKRLQKDTMSSNLRFRLTH